MCFVGWRWAFSGRFDREVGLCVESRFWCYAFVAALFRLPSGQIPIGLILMDIAFAKYKAKLVHCHEAERKPLEWPEEDPSVVAFASSICAEVPSPRWPLCWC